MKRSIWMALIIFLAGVQAVYAHHLWVFEENEGLAVGRGHFPDRLDNYNPVCVSEVKGYDQAGAPVMLDRKDTAGRAVVLPKQPASMISVMCDWGDRVNTTRGKKLMNRAAAEAKGFTVVKAFKSTQYSKTLLAAAKANCRPLGLKFELIPLSDPMAVKMGQPIDVKLLFDGKPLSGIQVLTNQDREYKTDANGVAQVTFEKRGKQLLYATNKVPAENEPGIDFRKYMTFLTFEVKE